MSYGICLYQKTFLKKAIEEDLVDWTNADDIEPIIRETIKNRMIEEGYILERESAVSTELIHPNDKWGLQVCIFKGEVSFTIPYWDDVKRAIKEAKRGARMIAQEFNLGYYDQQDGTIEY
ncbi:MAG: hypothetical protein JRJ85_12210 [Deltaproteobacteria bacterium]|nr:hypothetical protein [Deltaproteobacteria bacterium]